MYTQFMEIYRIGLTQRQVEFLNVKMGTWECGLPDALRRVLDDLIDLKVEEKAKQEAKLVEKRPVGRPPKEKPPQKVKKVTPKEAQWQWMEDNGTDVEHINDSMKGNSIWTEVDYDLPTNRYAIVPPPPKGTPLHPLEQAAVDVILRDGLDVSKSFSWIYVLEALDSQPEAS